MSGPDNETLTAALRRLADERASGLLSVATPGRDVVVELEDGAPVAIGPAHDAADRLGSDATEGLVTAAVVDDLVGRTVAAIVGGGGEWIWDVESGADRLPVPPGLIEELARRAVDAAQALAVVDPDDILEPGHDITTTGELDRVRSLFDGERSITDVAEVADLTVPAVATMAAALVAAGALATGDEIEDEPVSWQDAVRAADDDDEDEPELWVADPPEDDEFDEPEDEPAPRTARFATVAPTPATPEPPSEPEAPATDERPSDDAASETDDSLFGAVTTPLADDAEPLFDKDVASDESASDDPEVDDSAPPPPRVAGDWNDTTWLDELSPQDRAEDAPPVLAAGDEEPQDARAALSSMLSDLQQDDPPPAAAPPPPPATDEEPAEVDEEPAVETERREPRAEPGEVAEFLRELSRLALDDD